MPVRFAPYQRAPRFTLEIKMKKPTLRQMYNFCRARYYTDSDNIWRPFEYESEDQIAEYIESDVYALADFLGLKVKHTDYLKLMNTIEKKA